MYWNDHKTAISSKPVKKTVVNSSKVFASEGNPQMGQPATILTGDFVNTVQEELINVVEKAGLTPDKSDDTQLYQAIKAISNSGIPRPFGNNGSILTVVDKEKEIVEWQKPNVVKVVQGSVDIYVATTGDDKTGDGSKDRPWQTIQKAVEESYKYVAGSSISIYIRIAKGTYNETVLVDGNAQHSIISFAYEDGVIIRAPEDKYARHAMYIGRGAFVYHYGTPTFHSTATDLDDNYCAVVLVYGKSFCFFENGLNIILSNPWCAISVDDNSTLYIKGKTNINYSKNINTHMLFHNTRHSCFGLHDFLGLIHGNPNFTNAALITSLAAVSIIYGNSSFTGNATGRRFHLSELSFVHSFGKGVNFLPGSAAGEAYHGSQYI